MRAWQYVGWRIGPVALGLFACIGQIKANPVLVWSPVDLTLVLAAVVVAASIWSHVASGPANKAALIAVALFVILGLGLIQSSFDSYAVSKVVGLYTFTLMCAIAPFYLLRTVAQRRMFLMTLAGLGFIVSAVTLVSPVHPRRDTATYSTESVFLGTDTIGTARLAATALIVLLIAAAGGRLKRVPLVVSFVGAAISLAALLATQSRGPLVGTILALAVALVATSAFRRIRIRATIGVAVALAGLVVFIAFSGNGDRVVRLFTGTGDASVGARMQYWQHAISNIQPAPWGIGWGGFARLLGLDAGVHVYPHNLVLEVALEAGWVAGLAVIAYLAWTLVRARRNAVTIVEAVILALLVFTVVNALVSGDINSNRLMWILAGCALSTLSSRTQHGHRFEHSSRGRPVRPGSPAIRGAGTNDSRIRLRAARRSGDGEPGGTVEPLPVLLP